MNPMNSAIATSNLHRVNKAADELIRRVSLWLQDPHGEPTVPHALSVQIESAAITCREVGDVCPGVCVPLQSAIWRVQEEHRGYVTREPGKIRLENGAPGPGFWGALKAVILARVESEPSIIEVLEPVSVLLKQGVSYAQIGTQIYGRGGVGPFIQPTGDVNVALIEQEAKEPGSVVPADWVPLWEIESLKRRKAAIRSPLDAFSAMETAKKYDDPATVEELLREGAFVQQIERAKNVTREHVLEVASRIGVEAVDGPAYQPALRYRSSETGVGDNAPASDNGNDDNDEHDSDGDDADREALTELVIEMYQSSNNQKGAAEIATELRQTGQNITTRQVAAMIGHHRRKSLSATS